MTTLRDAFGGALASAGDTIDDLFVVDGDNHLATRTTGFRDRYPDRFVQAGVAEANMVGLAAGLAYSGHRVVACTFAAFLIGRGLQMIRDTIALDRLPVILVGTHAGISVGQDGVTHMALDDVAIMRGLPNMTVVVPSDPRQVTALLPQLLALEAPAYLRISRWGLGEVPTRQGPTLGVPILLETGADCVIVASGLGVFPALEARRTLIAERISVGIMLVHTIKPLDSSAVLEYLETCRAVVVVEESWSKGGLFGAIAELLAENLPKTCLAAGLADTFPDGGTEASLFDAYGLNSDSIAGLVRQAIAMTSGQSPSR